MLTFGASRRASPINLALAMLGAAGVLTACDGPPSTTITELPEVDDPLELVDPEIGAGGFAYGYGSAFVGAAAPHGLAKVGPDTSGPGGALPFHHYSGYWAEDDTVLGFSHLHLHGAGLADYGVLAIMPTTAFDPAKRRSADYARTFQKSMELMRPGVYFTHLLGAQTEPYDGIWAQLVATPHAALEVYDFEAGHGALIIDLAHALYGGDVSAAEVTVDAEARTVTGSLHHSGQMSGSYGGYDLYFVIEADQPFAEATTWSDAAAPGPVATASGTGVGVALTFAGDPGQGQHRVQLRVGLSLVSAAGARANLAAELPDWDAAAVAARTAAAWRERLEVVKLTSGDEHERRIFYTSLYQSFLMPTLISDADGAYRLAGAEAPRMIDGRAMLSDLSLWDTYRTLHPLYAWLAPDAALATSRSLLAFAEQDGGLPRWPIATGESGTMVGAPAEIVLADAALRGVPRAVDVAEAAWPMLYATAIDPATPADARGSRAQLELYLEYGYLPATAGRGVSKTTEFAHADFALGQLAQLLGHADDAATLAARARGWRLLFDPASGFLRGKRPDGSWAIADAEFDPFALSSDYAEANAWHSLWMTANHDPAGLASLFGGADAAIVKLTEFFEGARADRDQSEGNAYWLSPRPYYWHGNEHDLNAAYVFAQLGRPDLTQRWVRWIMDTFYRDAPDGKAGNDDGGALASWYVWSALGLYPIAGSDRVIIGVPRFPRARVIVGGHELRIVAEGVSATRPYVQAVSLDGVAITTPELTQAQLASGNELRFEMGARPSAWGRTP